MNNDLTIRTANYAAAQEIKASAHYAYVVNEYVPEGQCLVMDNVTGKYEKYAETTPGTFEPGKSNPVILDESIQFKANSEGVNPDLTAGQVLVHGAVYASILTGVTTAFKTALAGAIRFV